MTADTSPPARTTHTWQTPGGSWSYDLWGHNGRPVILLHAILFDRTMWWPVAAELRTDATVIAADLPGHGTSPARARYDPGVLVEELAQLLHDLGATQAPVIVGHGTSASLAGLFAARYFAHAVVTVDAAAGQSRCGSLAAGDVDGYLATMTTDQLPAYYRTLVTARPDPALLAGYGACLPDSLRAEADFRPHQSSRSGPHPHRYLAVYSEAPSGGGCYPLTVPERLWRSTAYDRPGQFAHLANVKRFAADVRCLL